MNQPWLKGTQFTTRELLIATFCACFTFAAIRRGHNLLGGTAAVAFGILAAGISFLIWKALSRGRRSASASKFFIVAIACVVIFVFVFPARFNPDLGVFIRSNQIRRTTIAKLDVAVAQESRFKQIDYRCRSSSRFFEVTVFGAVKNQSELDELRTTIRRACPNLVGRSLHWQVQLDDTLEVRHGSDAELFLGFDSQ